MGCLKLTYRPENPALKVVYNTLNDNEKSCARKYLYGFNGHRKDNEIYGEGNEYNFGDRMYDSRLARFPTPDKLGFIFPWQSPYAYSMNSPMTFVDYEGMGPVIANDGQTSDSPMLDNTPSSSGSSVHPLDAVVKVTHPKGPVTSKKSPNYRRYHGNYDEVFNVVPGQSQFWYGDAGVYDRIQLVIDNPPPPTVIWDSNNHRPNMTNNGKTYYEPTNVAFPNQKHPLGLLQSPGTSGGWGEYNIPAIFNGQAVTQIHVVVTTWQDVNDPLHNIPVNSGASLGAQQRSVWAFDVIVNTPQKHHHHHHHRHHHQESHENTRFL